MLLAYAWHNLSFVSLFVGGQKQTPIYDIRDREFKCAVTLALPLNQKLPI